MNMNKMEFIEQLRATAEALKPLTESVSLGQRVWNGNEYARTNELKQIDPHALAWWSTLVAIAELIDAQEAFLSAKQIAYLDRLLFGGMGSLNDLCFDPKVIGASADLVNKRLNETRRALFASFKQVINGVR